MTEPRVAVVTGAASGIGRALAALLGARGYSLVLADVDTGRLAEAAGELSGLAIPTDVADVTSMRALAEAVGPCELLCLNAGIVSSSPGPPWDSPAEYQGLDPVTGKEKRSWHPAGTTREEAVQLAARLAAELNGRNDEVRSLTFGAYLTNTWLPGKRITLAESTWDGYRRKIDRHILPTIGHLRIQRLRAHHLETLYDRMLYPTDDRRPLAPKTVLEVHLIIRGALNHAEERTR